jgi:hypothetical protein
MPSHTVETPRAATGSGEELGRFYTGMAEGLHALAQPLTILRSSIAAANSAGITQERQRYYLDISKSQVDRACELFASLQQLAISAQSPVDRSPSVEGELP